MLGATVSALRGSVFSSTKNSSRVVLRELFSVYGFRDMTDRAGACPQPCQMLLRLMSFRLAAPHMVMVDLSSPTILSMYTLKPSSPAP